MAKTRRGSAFRPRVRRSSPPPTGGSSAAPPAAAVAPLDAAQGSAVVGSSAVELAPRQYHTRVGPTPPSQPHPRPARRAPPSKRARTSSPGESSNSRPQEPQSPPHQSPTKAPPFDLFPASIIRWPLFHCNPIPGNADCSERELHARVHYDLPDFSQDPELQDSMLLVQQYSLGSFMTPRQFFYPRVVIDFYHTMTSRLEPNPTAIHFSIDGRPGILRASNIIATFNLVVVLANSAAYRQWPHPSPRKMVRLLSGDTTVGMIMFRRQLPSRMRLIDHILRSNVFLLQHIVQRRGAILEALYCISEGFCFSLSELIMTSLFHFEDKVHRRSLPRAESTPLLFPRLLCQVLEHIGFPEEPRLERRRDCKVICHLRTQPRTSQLPIFHLRTSPPQQSTLQSLRLQPLQLRLPLLQYLRLLYQLYLMCPRPPCQLPIQILLGRALSHSLNSPSPSPPGTF